MRATASRWIAAASALAALGALEASRRPRYGGTLRIEMRAAVRSLDPAEGAAEEKLLAQVFETLVRLDERGEPQPLLATSWTHEPARKRWVFAVRSNVTLHSGARWEPPGGIVSVPDDQPIEKILRDLARPRNAVVVRSGDGAVAGTGPFRVSKWEPGRALTLAAHENYWGGRPYLDEVEIQLGRTPREQALDFELGKADVAESSWTEVRRLRQRGGSVAISAPVETLALVFEDGGKASESLREGLALSIDRAAIHNVLLQKQGEISGALLPQWLSGYAFLFPAGRNLTRARQLAVSAPPLTFTYDRQDAPLKAVAERIALNTGEAGISLRPASGATGDVRLARLRISAPEPWQALEDLTSFLKVPTAAAPPPNPYELERALLAGFRVIPLFHLPAVYQVSARVRNWIGAEWARSDRWKLENVWLEERGKP